MFRNLARSNREYPTRSFFDYLAVSVLWSYPVPTIFQYILLLSSNLQVIVILLWGQLELIMRYNDPGLLNNLSNMLKLFASRSLFDAIEKTTILNPFVIGAWAYFLLFFLVLGIIIKNFYAKKKYTNTETAFITVISQFHLSIGFWVVNIGLLDILSANYSALGEEIDNLMAFLPALLLITLNYFICAYYSIFSYHPFIESSVFSCHNPIFQITTFIFKAVISLTITLSNEPTITGWSFTISSFIILAYQHYNLVSTFPYFEYRPMKIALISSSISLSISMMNLFIMAVESLSSELFICVEGFLIVMMVQVTLNYFAIVIKRYLIIDKHRLRSEQDVLKKVFALRHLFERSNVTLCSNREATRNEINFWGIWSSLVKQESSLKALRERNLDKDCVIETFRKYYSKCEQKIITAILKEATSKFKRTDKLKIMVCNLSLEHDEQVSTGMYYLTALSKPQGLNRIVTLKLHQKVQQKVYSFFNGDLTQEKTLDLKSYMDLESVANNFLQMVYLNTKKYVTFWEKYRKSGTRIKELYKTHLDIEKNSDNILSFWKNNIECNRVFAGSLNTIYGIYLALVRNSPASGRKTLDKYGLNYTFSIRKYNQEGPLSQENLSSPDNITFYASMAKERAGRILYVSPNITELLGWAQDSLKGVNVSRLLPNFMKKRHEVALIDHLDKTAAGITSPRLYKNVMTFVKDKAGYKVPCYVYLSLYPYIHGELIYTAIVRLRRSETNIILVNDEMEIEGLTKDIADQLKLEPNKKIKIKEICENPKTLERALDNLSKLITQQSEGLKRKKRYHGFVEDMNLAGSVNLNEEDAIEEFTSNLCQTIKVRFRYPSGEFPNNGSSSKIYSVHITPRRFWDMHYFILKLNENPSTEIRYPSNAVQKIMSKIHESREEINSPEIPNELAKHSVGSSPQLFPATLLVKTKSVFRSTIIQKIKSPSPTKKERGFLSKTSLQSDIPESLEIKDFHDKSSPTLDGEEYRKDKKGREGILEVFHLDTTNTTSSAMGTNYNSKVEEAVYRVPKDRGLRVVRVLIVMFIVLTSALLIGFEIESDNVITRGADDATVIKKSLILLKEICEINKAVRLVKILKALDLTREDRSRYRPIGLNISTLETLEDNIRNKTNELSQVNSFVRSSMYHMDTGIQKQIFENLIPVYEIGSNQTGESNMAANLFDLTTSIVIKSIKLSSEGYQANQDLTFILENTINSILVFGENISSLLMKSNHIALDRLLDFIMIAIILMGAFGIFLLCLNIHYIAIFAKKKNQLIDIMERLDTAQIEKQIDWVNKFIGILEENSMDSKKINIKLGKIDLSKMQAAKNNAKNVKKSFITRGSSETLIIFLLSKALLIMMIFSAYVVIFIFTQEKTKVLGNEMDSIMAAASYLYQLSLLSTLTYEYIDLNATSKVRNHPIGEEWSSVADRILYEQTFLVSEFFEEYQDPGSNIPIQLLLTGNICNEIGLQEDQDITLCNSIAGGTLRNGLVGLTNFALNTLDTVKGMFDTQFMLAGAKTDILNMKDFVVLEAMMNLFYPAIYKELDKRTENHLKEDYKEANTAIKNITIIYLVICVVFGGSVCHLVERGFEREITGWRKIIRQIPYEIVSTNKMLKNYIVNNSEGILNGIKKSF